MARKNRKIKENIIIATNDRWAFHNALCGLFFNAYGALERMEDLWWGTFTSPLVGGEYRFSANAKGGYYKLVKIS